MTVEHPPDKVAPASATVNGSAHRNDGECAKSNLPWTTWTGRMRELERVVRAMPDVTGTAFKLFTAVTQGVNEGTGEFHCRDEVMCITCGARRRQSLSEARAALASKRLLDFEPGRPGKATVYRLLASDNDIMDQLAILADRKVDAKMGADKDRPRRNRVRKSAQKRGREIGPGEAAIDAASGNPDTKPEISVRKSGHPAYAKANTLLPEQTPFYLSTDGELHSVRASAGDNGPSDSLIEWPSKTDLDRGEKAISIHLAKASRDLGFTVADAVAEIGAELGQMKRAVAEFPGDEVAAARRIWSVLSQVKDRRDAAA
ncbi:MAG: hypothetical protein GY873_39115 [Bosea sp.]|uniref:hypothetical protein n=1 Tax=Bosea sp. (in: a-proteobacteria) TaxID=1871050 RepID=UPI002383D8EB|nr:hypothetical protein [Bosea sp. (in: a-proteobacteria)]MCP4740215.1 hypothetical protein [Bosea sp. (in: a-proteobacteria)]